MERQAKNGNVERERIPISGGLVWRGTGDFMCAMADSFSPAGTEDLSPEDGLRAKARRLRRFTENYKKDVQLCRDLKNSQMGKLMSTLCLEIIEGVERSSEDIQSGYITQKRYNDYISSIEDFATDTSALVKITTKYHLLGGD